MVGWLLPYWPMRQKDREATAPPTDLPSTQDQHGSRRGQCPFDGHLTRDHWLEGCGTSQLTYGQHWQEMQQKLLLLLFWVCKLNLFVI